MGLDDLLRVLREEAANEERALREEATREAARILAEVRGATARLREEALAREGEVRASRLRAAREAEGLERERVQLDESRRQLDALREEALLRLREALSERDVERFVGELVAEAGPASWELHVDPGLAHVARRALAAAGAGGGGEVREAPAARGGVELVTGSLILDDTVASRLERAWPRVEPEIAGILFSEDAGGEP